MNSIWSSFISIAKILLLYYVLSVFQILNNKITFTVIEQNRKLDQ